MIKKQEISSGLESIGVSKGATVSVHSFLGTFEPFDGGLDAIIEAFQDVLGPEGTLIMPTYTIKSFLANGYYNHEESPSEVGALTEHFRKSPGVTRTLDPVYSHCVWGSDNSRFAQIETKDILGPDSVFAALVRKNAIMVLFGTSMSRGCTLIHHFERMVLAPYRYLKAFHGKIVYKNRTSYTRIVHYARFLDNPCTSNFNHLEQPLLSVGLAKTFQLPRGRILSVHARDLYAAAASAYDKNPYSLMKPA